tara:strand:- start:3661 stop:4029 length:369 start_codon:yes stop_codon:yes gene_type:complete
MTQETKKQKSVLDTATAHFRTKISGDMTHITVPEWGDAKIYFKSSNTLTEESRLLNLAQQGKTVEALVETLITKARKEDGSKMFTIHDKATFMNEVDPSVVIRVCGEMNQSLDSNLEIVEKN